MYVRQQVSSPFFWLTWIRSRQVAHMDSVTPSYAQELAFIKEMFPDGHRLVHVNET